MDFYAGIGQKLSILLQIYFFKTVNLYSIIWKSTFEKVELMHKKVEIRITN